MNYSGLFKRSWSITWRYPSMALVVLIGTLINLLLSFVLRPVFSPFAPVGSDSAFFINIVLMVVNLAITAFTAGALISMVNALEEGLPISVGFGVQAGLNRMVPLFFVTLVLQIPLWLVTVLQTRSLLGIFATSGQLSFGNPNALISTGLAYFMLNLFVALLVGAIGVGAERVTVLQKQSVLAALKSGWNLLWRKLKDFVVIGLIFLLLIVLLLVMYYCASSIFINYAAASIFSGTPSIASSLSSMFVNPVTALFFVVGILFSIFAAVFVSSVWTLAFREWQAQERSELSVAAQ